MGWAINCTFIFATRVLQEDEIVVVVPMDFAYYNIYGVLETILFWNRARALHALSERFSVRWHT